MSGILKFIWTIYRNTDTTGRLPLTYGQQSGQASFEGNRGQNNGRGSETQKHIALNTI